MFMYSHENDKLGKKRCKKFVSMDIIYEIIYSYIHNHYNIYHSRSHFYSPHSKITLFHTAIAVRNDPRMDAARFC